MKIEINSRRKVSFIQKEFTAHFPNLKIVFYKEPGDYRDAPDKQTIRKSSVVLAEYRTVHHSGMIALAPDMTAEELKQIFANEYALTIEIFQKNRNSTWSTSAANKKATLKELNREIPYAASL